MRIENMNTKEQWDKVVLHLTNSEALELRDALEAILREDKPGRHEHIPSADYKKEITIVVSSGYP